MDGYFCAVDRPLNTRDPFRWDPLGNRKEHEGKCKDCRDYQTRDACDKTNNMWDRKQCYEKCLNIGKNHDVIRYDSYDSYDEFLRFLHGRLGKFPRIMRETRATKRLRTATGLLGIQSKRLCSVRLRQ